MALATGHENDVLLMLTRNEAQADNSAGVVLERLKAVAMQADEALARAAGLYKESESTALASLKSKP